MSLAQDIRIHFLHQAVIGLKTIDLIFDIGRLGVDRRCQPARDQWEQFA